MDLKVEKCKFKNTNTLKRMLLFLILDLIMASIFISNRNFIQHMSLPYKCTHRHIAPIQRL